MEELKWVQLFLFKLNNFLVFYLKFYPVKFLPQFKLRCIHSLTTSLGTRCCVFGLQNYFNSSWQRFNKVLETFLRDFDPYWHASLTHAWWESPILPHPKAALLVCGGHLSSSYATNSSMNHWYITGWIHASMWLTPSECYNRNWDSSDQATFFQSASCYLRGMAPSVVFCCCSPAALMHALFIMSGFHFCPGNWIFSLFFDHSL